MRKNSAIAILFIFLVIIVSLTLFIKSSYFTGLVTEKVRTHLEKVIGRNIIFSKSYINLYPLYWKLEDVALVDKETGDKLLDVKEVRVYLSIRHLDVKTLVVRGISFTEPVLYVKRYPDGKLNLKGLFPKKKPSGWFVLVNRIDIDKGKVIYRDLQKKRRFVFTDMTGRLKPDLLKKEIQGNVKAIASYKDRKIHLRGLSIRGKAWMDIHREGTKDLRFHDFVVLSPGGSRLNLNGTIKIFKILDLKGAANLSLKEISKHAGLKKGLKGRLIFDGNITGEAGKSIINGKINGTRIIYENIKYGNLQGNLSYKERRVNLSSIKGTILNGSIKGNATLDLSEDKKEFYILMDGTGLKPYICMKQYTKKAVTHMEKNGKADFHIDLTGTGFTEKTISGNGWVNYKDVDQAVFLSGDIEQGEIRGKAKGTLSDVAMYLHIPKFPLHGPTTFTASITGSVDSPVIEAFITMPEGRAKEARFDSINAKLGFFNKVLTLHEVNLTKDDGTYTLHGEITFGKGIQELTYSVSGIIDKASPSDIISIFYKKLPLKMKVSGKATFSGKGKDFIFNANLKSSKGSVFGQGFDSATVLISIGKDRITFHKAVIRNGEDRIVEGNGWIGFAGDIKESFFIKVSSGEYNLENINFLKDKIPFIKGTGRFNITGNGKLTNPLFEVWIEVPNLYIKDVDTGQFRLFVNKDAQMVRLNGDTPTIRFNGTIDWMQNYPFTVTFNMKDAPIHPYLQFLQSSLAEDISLHVSGKTVVSGNLPDPDSIKINTTLTHVTGYYSDYTFENDGNIRLNYESRTLTFTSVNFKGPDTSLGMIGSIVRGGDINVFISGEAELRLLTLFTPEIKYSRGKAFVAFLISGETQNPAVRGGLVIKKGTIRSETLKQTLEDANISIFFNGKEIILEALNGTLGGGKITGTGKVEIAGFSIKEFGLILEVANAIFKYPEGMVSRIDGTLIFQGTPESKNLKGEVIIKKASYEKKINIRSVILEIQKKRVKVEKPIPFFGNTDLNVHIEGTKDIWINNNLAQLPLGVDLILRGTVDHPLIFGRIEAQGGTFIFSRNPFKIISATADFISTDRIKPVIDIHAVTDVRGYNIDLRLTGTVDRFNLILNADPPLSETDIIALLTVGQTAAEVAETMKVIGAMEATAFLAAPIQEKLESTIQNIIKIDRFQVEPYYSDSLSSGGARLTVGKRLLKDKLYVTYTTGITTIEELIKLEYFLGRNVYIVGERDEQGRVSGDIRFRLKFR